MDRIIKQAVKQGPDLNISNIFDSDNSSISYSFLGVQAVRELMYGFVGNAQQG